MCACRSRLIRDMLITRAGTMVVGLLQRLTTSRSTFKALSWSMITRFFKLWNIIAIPVVLSTQGVIHRTVYPYIRTYEKYALLKEVGFGKQVFTPHESAECAFTFD